MRHGRVLDEGEEAGVCVGTTSGEVFYSRNGGDSWELLVARLPAILALDTAVV